MNLRCRLHPASFLLLPWLLTAPAAGADATTPTSEKNEIVVFGGYSILDVSKDDQRTISLPDGRGLVPGLFPGRMPGIFPPIPIEIRSGTSLGGSALVGFRYSRSVKERLWVEADFAVGPSHDLRTTGGVCIQGMHCLGMGDFDRAGGRLGFPDLDFGRAGSRQVTAWHYGAGLAYELTGGDVRPLLILGAGGVSWSGAREARTDFVLRFGAGVKIHFGRVGLRLEGVDHFIPDFFLGGKGQHDVHVTAGLLVRF